MFCRAGVGGCAFCCIVVCTCTAPPSRTGAGEITEELSNDGDAGDHSTAELANSAVLYCHQH